MQGLCLRRTRGPLHRSIAAETWPLRAFYRVSGFHYGRRHSSCTRGAQLPAELGVSVMRRVQRQYRIAIAAGAIIGLVVAFVIWSSGSSGGSSSSDTQFLASESDFDSLGFGEPNFTEPTEWTAASTTRKPGPVGRPAKGVPSAAKVDPLPSVGVVADSPGVTTEARRQTARTQPAGQAADSDNRAGVASSNNSGPASSQSAHSAAARTG